MSTAVRVGSKESGADDCGLLTMPEPVLSECTDAMPADVPDHRGYWYRTLMNS
jgi:hypothetical protein